MNLHWTLKILSAFILIIAVMVILNTIYLGSNLKNFLIAQKEEELKRDLNQAVWLLADHLGPNQNDPSRIRLLAENVGHHLQKRVTIFSKEGRVLGDSAFYREMVNRGVDFSNQPEILAVKTKGYGQIVRFSPAIQSNALFGAIPVRKEGVLLGFVRIALPLNQIEEVITSMRWGLYLGGGLTTLLALLLSFLLTRSMGRSLGELSDMVQRMAGGDLKQPFHLLAQSEISDLATSMESLAADLSQKKELLETETDELKTLLSTMREGVLVTDKKGRIILMNPFLKEILGEKAPWKGRSVQEAFMNAELEDAVEAVLKGDPFQRLELTFGRDLQRNFEVQVVALTSQHRPPRAVAIFHETT